MYAKNIDKLDNKLQAMADNLDTKRINESLEILMQQLNFA